MIRRIYVITQQKNTQIISLYFQEIMYIDGIT